MELQPKQIFFTTQLLCYHFDTNSESLYLCKHQPLYTDQLSCLLHSTTDQISLFQSLFSYLDYVVSIIT